MRKKQKLPSAIELVDDKNSNGDGDVHLLADVGKEIRTFEKGEKCYTTLKMYDEKEEKTRTL